MRFHIPNLKCFLCVAIMSEEIGESGFFLNQSMFDCSEVDTRVRLLNKVGKSALHVTDHALVLRNKHHNNQKSWV